MVMGYVFYDVRPEYLNITKMSIALAQVFALSYLVGCLAMKNETLVFWVVQCSTLVIY
jgi:hypothetical protein